MFPVTRENVDSLPGDFFPGVNCRWCVYWEFPDEFGSLPPEESSRRKREWLLAAPRSRGVLAVAGRRVIGYAQFAPSRDVPAAEFYSDRPSGDALLLTCVAVAPTCRGQGVGSALVARAAEEAVEAGFPKLEAYGSRVPDAPTAPLGFLLGLGFRVVGRDERFPLVRMDLRPGGGSQPPSRTAVIGGKGAADRGPHGLRSLRG